MFTFEYALEFEYFELILRIIEEMAKCEGESKCSNKECICGNFNDFVGKYMEYIKDKTDIKNYDRIMMTWSLCYIDDISALINILTECPKNIEKLFSTICIWNFYKSQYNLDEYNLNVYKFRQYLYQVISDFPRSNSTKFLKIFKYLKNKLDDIILPLPSLKFVD